MIGYKRIVVSAYTDIAEKRIAELEKENNKLESRNDNLVKMYNEVVERQNSFQQSLYKNIEELEKENAELKAQIEKLKKQFEPQDMVQLMNEIEAPYKLQEAEEKIDTLQKRNGKLAGKVANLNRWLEEAKSLIRNLLKGAEGASIRASEYLYDL